MGKSSANIKLTTALRKAGIIKLSFYDNIQDLWICLVNPLLVKVDVDGYQRDHDTKHSDRLAGVDLPVTPYPICGITDDRLTLDVYDGQHRVQRAVKKKIPEIYVMVKFGLTPEQRAELYAELQIAKRPPLWNVFKARLASGSPMYISMAATCRKLGLTLLCDERNADMRCVDPMVEAQRSDLFLPWATLLCAFKNSEGRLQKRASTSAIEFQRGLIDLIRKHGPGIVAKATPVFKECGASFFDDEAGLICHCSRTNRSHFAQAFEGTLVSRGIIKVHKTHS